MGVLWLVAFLLFWLWAYVLRGGSRLGGFFIVGHRRTLAILALPIVGIAALLLATPQVPYRNPELAASPFQWPAVCQQRRYRTGDFLTRQCHSALPRISRSIAQANGFDDGGRGRADFYRLGNDAAAISCFPGTNKCHVRNIHRNVFVVPE